MLDRYVGGMALIRFLSAAIELSAAMLMLKLNRVDRALQVNAVLALVGPTIFLSVTAVGLFGLAGKVPLSKMLIIILGVGLIFYGIRRA